MSVEAFLSLGSNMGDRLGYLELGVQVLRGVDPDLRFRPSTSRLRWVALKPRAGT